LKRIHVLLTDAARLFDQNILFADVFHGEPSNNAAGGQMRGGQSCIGEVTKVPGDEKVQPVGGTDANVQRIARGDRDA
jgi:hypothetical protein